jgi:hypothetical protein
LPNRLSYSAPESPVGRVGAAGAAYQQGVAGEHPVLGDQAHRVARMPGRVQHLQPQLAHHHHVAVVDVHVHHRRRAGAVHDQVGLQLLRK